MKLVRIDSMACIFAGLTDGCILEIINPIPAKVASTNITTKPIMIGLFLDFWNEAGEPKIISSLLEEIDAAGNCIAGCDEKEGAASG